jgi:hypothetical protein
VPETKDARATAGGGATAICGIARHDLKIVVERRAGLPFSLIARVDNILSWTKRYSKLTPITAIEVESVPSIRNCYKIRTSAGSNTNRGHLPDTKSGNTSCKNGDGNASTATRRISRWRSIISFPKPGGDPIGPVT